LTENIHVTVDRAQFLEVGRVLKRVYRYTGKQVVLTLGNSRLLIEFTGGGCELPCETPENLVAEVTTKSFVGIIAAYSRDKSPDKTIKLTFRPELGEFATPLAGAKAKYRK
jgi:hypothetical protein